MKSEGSFGCPAWPFPGAYCLATADHTGSSLATFDEKIQRAAQAEGIELAGITRRRKR